ncbi:MAG: hypothetical protein PVH68_17310, partial [Armatimonadota bacterium]
MDTPRGPIHVGLGLTVVMIAVGVIALVYVARAPTAETPEHLVVPHASTEFVLFDIRPLDRVARAAVDEFGLVDYEALGKDHADLDAFLK